MGGEGHPAAQQDYGDLRRRVQPADGRESDQRRTGGPQAVEFPFRTILILKGNPDQHRVPFFRFFGLFGSNVARGFPGFNHKGVGTGEDPARDFR